MIPNITDLPEQETLAGQLLFSRQHALFLFYLCTDNFLLFERNQILMIKKDKLIYITVLRRKAAGKLKLIWLLAGLGAMVLSSQAIKTANGQPVSFRCTPDRPAFSPGEKLKYEVYYNWGFVWLHAGVVDFRADTCLWKGKPAWHFVSTGKSRSSYDWFFRVRDRYESWATREEMKPLEFIRDTYEGGYKCDNHYLFDYKAGKLRTTFSSSKREEAITEYPISGCLNDVLTAAYLLRTFDAAEWAVGQVVPLRLAIDDKIYVIIVRYLGREVIANRKKEAYRCLKFSTTVAAGSIFKGDEAIKVWVTDDDRHIPVLVEAEILVGSVKVYLGQ